MDGSSCSCKQMNMVSLCHQKALRLTVCILAAPL